jgi:hypothetical protein
VTYVSGTVGSEVFPRPSQERVMTGRRLVSRVVVTFIVALAAGWAVPPDAAAQECGNGTTFTVVLPSIRPGGDGDTITLPAGCRIYTLFVSGYARNPELDELTFYRLAKFVAENDGYVHWAWWNNVLKPYMEGPLHIGDTVTNPVTGVVYKATPGALPGVHALGFVPASHEFSLVPKAVPEEDTQFQADAKILLRRVREVNPGAVIVVAGHSMGGNSVARLGANTPVDIDLLGPMDPVGNRSGPIGRPTLADPRPDRTYNWTRWRAKWEFAGFKITDCVRNAIGLCQNFGTLFRPEFRCRTVGGLLDQPPPFPASLAPLLCPGPWKDNGRELTYGSRIKRLYHRWQNETLFPFDFLTNEIYKFHGSRTPKTTFSPSFTNIQFPVDTCAIGIDPGDPNRLCNPGDGHGEVVGFRSPTPGQPNPPGPNVPVAPLANQALNWAQYAEDQPVAVKTARAAIRREKLLELPTADEAWPHRPIDPDLDLVAGDMVKLLVDIFAGEPVPSLPTTVATPTPGPNEHGWNNTDVSVNLEATAGTERKITSIEYSLSGAQSGGPTVVHSDSVDVPITAEGDTTVTFFARDDGANVEEPQQLTVRVDKTPPVIAGTPMPAPNANRWNNTDVTVSFTAADALSGVEVIDPPVTLTAEGAGQEAIGTATDRAGNTSATIVTIHIDKTPPILFGLPDPACLLWPPNQKLVLVASVGASDGLSDVAPATLVVGATSSEGGGNGDIVIVGTNVQVRSSRNGGGSGRTYTVTASVRDLAGNAATQSGGCFVPHDRGRR